MPRPFSGGGIPVGVALCNLSAVWNLQTTAGYTQPLTNLAASATLPAGCTRTADEIRVPGGVTATFNNWDFTGYTVNVYSTGNATFNQCLFAASGTQYAVFRMGNPDISAGSSPNATCNYCTFDLTNVSKNFAAPIYIQGADPVFNTSFCKIINAPTAHLAIISSNSATINLTDTYFAGIGRKAGYGTAPLGTTDHLECVVHHIGTVTYTRVFVDVRDKQPLYPNGMTGLIYPESGYGSTCTSVLTDCILAGAAESGSSYTIQFQGALNNTATFTNCVLRSGVSGYLSINSGAVGRVTGTGCKDYYTGAAITIP